MCERGFLSVRPSLMQGSDVMTMLKYAEATVAREAAAAPPPPRLSTFPAIPPPQPKVSEVRSSCGFCVHCGCHRHVVLPSCTSMSLFLPSSSLSISNRQVCPPPLTVFKGLLLMYVVCVLQWHSIFLLSSLPSLSLHSHTTWRRCVPRQLFALLLG